MNDAAAARISALDSVVDGVEPTAALSDDLFSVSDVLAAQPTLRRTLSDPGMPEGVRVELSDELFTNRVSADAAAILREAARLRWASSGALLSAVERQAVRAVLRAAQAAGHLADVEDQLFKVERLVAGSLELQTALTDRSVAVEARAALLGGLLAGKTLPATQILAARAVAARERPFGATIEGYLSIAAALKKQAIATVVVARPLAAKQLERLTAILHQQAGRDVHVRVVVDPQVLGGVRVTMGDEVIEGTVAARLTDAHRKLG